VRRANIKGNFSRRSSEKFFPLAWREADFVIEDGKLILLGERVTVLKVEGLAPGARRVVISQDWKKGLFLLFVDY